MSDEPIPAPRPRPSLGPSVPPASGAAAPLDAVTLVDRLIAHDDAVFEELVRTRGPRMLAIAARYLPRAADAEDALQAAFAKVAGSVGKLPSPDRLDPWLHRVVVGCALTSLSREAKSAETTAAAARRVGAAAALEPSPVETAGVGRDAAQRALRDALDRLPATQRAVLLLRDAESLDIGSIAELLAVDVPVARVRLLRARKALRRGLGSRVAELRE